MIDLNLFLMALCIFVSGLVILYLSKELIKERKKKKLFIKYHYSVVVGSEGGISYPFQPKNMTIKDITVHEILSDGTKVQRTDNDIDWTNLKEDCVSKSIDIINDNAWVRQTPAVNIRSVKNKNYVYYTSERVCEIKNETEIFIDGKSFFFTVNKEGGWQVVENGPDRLPYAVPGGTP